MKLKNLIALTVTAVAVFAFTACGNSKTEGPTGIFLTYGEENSSYAFVDPENETVFLAELPVDKIKDEKGNPLKLEDLKDGDTIQLADAGIMTNSIPPIYSDIKEVIRLEEGSEELAEKYRPLIEEYLDPPADPSMIPAFSIETSQSLGTVTTAIFETSYEWNYTDEEGKEQHLVLSEGEEAEYSTLDLEKENEEGKFYFSSTPKEFKLLEYVGEETKEVEVTKTDEGYSAHFNPDVIYELQGIWENGTVNYKFQTKLLNQ